MCIRDSRVSFAVRGLALPASGVHTRLTGGAGFTLRGLLRLSFRGLSLGARAAFCALICGAALCAFRLGSRRGGGLGNVSLICGHVADLLACFMKAADIGYLLADGLNRTGGRIVPVSYTHLDVYKRQ